MAEEREGPVLSRVILAFLLSVAGHLIAVTVAWVLADGMGHELTAAQALLSIPVVLLAALVPVSVGGWGVRESIAAIVLARIGWTMEDAVALSLIFGLTQLFAASPGALLRLQSPGREEEE